MVVKIILDILVLLLFDVILSVDNAILISMSTRELKGKDRKLASIIGAIGAVMLRLIFVVLIIFFFEALSSVKVIYIIGGLLIAWIAWNITKDHKEGSLKIKSSTKVLKVVAMIMAADLIMSFDNAFIIAEVVMEMHFGDLGIEALIAIKAVIIIIALLISLILIVCSSVALAKFIEKNKWVMYVGCWLLMSAATEMVLNDSLIKDLLPGSHILWIFFAYWMGGILTMFNWYFRAQIQI